jgi:hypothetical protein
MKLKTSKAKDQVLNYLVAKCEGKTKLYQIRRGDSRVIDTDHPEYFEQYKRQHDEYSTDWALAGPIIEREKLGVWWATHYVDDDGVEYGNHWYAEPGCTDDNADKPYSVAFGPTPLIAAMRCYVASKLGDEVEVPDELA